MNIDTNSLNNVENELIIGLAGGLGVDFDKIVDLLTANLNSAGYHVEIIRISSHFQAYNSSSKFAEKYWRMQYGSKLRMQQGNDYWAKQVIAKIFLGRPALSKKHKKIAYIVRSLKNKDELELLSNVYGRNFISISIFCETEASVNYLYKKLKLNKFRITDAQQEINDINAQMKLGDDMDIRGAAELYLDDSGEVIHNSDQSTMIKFLLRKDQEETHPDLHMYGQHLYKCYSLANYFLYQNKNLDLQIRRFMRLLFNDPFAEPTPEEYFMFCAQAAAYRSLDLDRQIGAVIINAENELVAVGFNDVSKIGGGHYAHQNHPMYPNKHADHRDFKQHEDFNHRYLDQIVHTMARKLRLDSEDELMLRDEMRGVTEFKRSTHGEMSALLDAARRGVSVRDCTIFINTYPCHNCTKHLIAAGIKKVIFLHPYTKSKAREMYKGMIKHGLFTDHKEMQEVIIFEPFLGLSPNRYMQTFSNDKDTRLVKENGRENGKIVNWEINKNSIPRELRERLPHSYISREWAVIHNKLPDMSDFYR